MQNPFTTPAAQNFGLMAGRVSLGAYFVASGYRKIQGDVDHFVAANSGHMPTWMPGPWGKEYLHFLPFAEIVFGLLLAAGLKTRMSAFMVTVMLVLSFIVAMSGISSGGNVQPSVIFLCLAVLLLTNGGGNLTLTNLVRGGGGGGGKPAGAK